MCVISEKMNSSERLKMAKQSEKNVYLKKMKKKYLTLILIFASLTNVNAQDCNY